MKQPIISVSGLRGIVGESLSPELAVRFVAAFAAEIPAGPIVLSRDGRTTGSMFSDALRGGLSALGREVFDLGVAATPTVGVMVRSLQAAGGVQISASHNPPEYNGLKLFDASGRVLPAERGQRVLERFHQAEPEWVTYTHIGTVREVADTLAPHLAAVLATVDVPRIRARGFRVLLDSNHGAGSVLGRRLLSELGCEGTLVGDTPDGRFAHPPEPTAENLQGVSSMVIERTAAVGFCQDPDADRLAVIDERGRYVGEEYTLALCLDHVLRQTPGPIVTNCATSRMAEDLAAKYGVAFHRSAVGEANVVDRMIAERAVFGGEGNGGPIDPRVGWVRDSFVGMALILDAIASRDVPLSQLVDELPRYAIHKTKVEVSREQTAAAFDRLESHFPSAEASRQDGLRLDWPGRWLLVRGSNTEPIVRIIAEAESDSASQDLCEQARRVIQSVDV